MYRQWWPCLDNMDVSEYMLHNTDEVYVLLVSKSS